jgi:hypothetical protein
MRGRGSGLDPRLLDAFDAIAPELYSEIGKAEDTVVYEALRKLVSKYYLSTEGLAREQSAQTKGDARVQQNKR